MDNCNALVIDDSKAMRLILCRMLRELGLEVTEASNGSEGLTKLAGGLSPTLILVDWNMPEMTGIEFIEAVRNAPYESQAKVIMVTTETELPQMQRALSSGADEYVMKPFTREAIHEKLQLVGLQV
jgi:two-component system, chemotaxis family, chemotaxis protein CheY